MFFLSYTSVVSGWKICQQDKRYSGGNGIQTVPRVGWCQRVGDKTPLAIPAPPQYCHKAKASVSLGWRKQRGDVTEGSPTWLMALRQWLMLSVCRK